MTTLERVRRCVGEVLALEPDQVTPESRLIEGLGAESLDLVELMYLLEQEFAIHFDKADLSLSAQLGLPEDQIHQAEVLTPAALAALRAQRPDAGERLREGMTRQELAVLMTVADVASSVERKLQRVAG